MPLGLSFYVLQRQIYRTKSRTDEEEGDSHDENDEIVVDAVGEEGAVLDAIDETNDHVDDSNQCHNLRPYSYQKRDTH